MTPQEGTSENSKELTYWNGEPAECDKVVVKVGPATEDSPPRAWWRPFIGHERDAVRIAYVGRVWYIDDQGYEQSEDEYESLRASVERFAEMQGRDVDREYERMGVKRPNDPEHLRVGYPGWGWDKVTKGFGGPRWGHADLATAVPIKDRT